MARFRHRSSGAVVSATRLKSPKQIETQNRGWITAGVGNWEIIDPTPGSRPLVLEDPGFREQYEAGDPDATVALDAPHPGTLQQTPQPTPAPPDHMAAQALPAQKSAEEYAAERREMREAAIAEQEAEAAAAAKGADSLAAEAARVDPITGAGDAPEGDPETPVDPITGEPLPAEDLSVPGTEAPAADAPGQAGEETPAPKKPKQKGSGRSKRSRK